ncbi:FecCD family ABC transporter permease [Rubritalea tangerina]|uniref:FecCD family ABC transporter permease n=1 Tax=Rubritalea tangerina TaxID=430798 RepID=A0ABW4Z8M7_9BACT
MKPRVWWMVLLAMLSVFIAPSMGEAFLWLPERSSTEHLVYWEVRVPRVMMAFLCGAALALGGLVFQAMFRNPLATPYTLGVASGSTFSVALWINFGVNFSLLGVSGLSLAALLGALLSVMLVYHLAKWAGGLATVSLLLGGVILSFFFSSLTMLTQYFADAGSMFKMMRWTMGSLGQADYDGVLTVAPFVLVGVIFIAQYRSELDVISVGDELALSRGVEVKRVRRVLFFAVSLMMAGVVSVCGPIGFIGIMVPHFCRMLFGVVHRELVWLVILFGGVFLVWCDTLARGVTVGSDLPVGIITALIGAPFFLIVLLKKVRQ